MLLLLCFSVSASAFARRQRHSSRLIPSHPPSLHLPHPPPPDRPSTPSVYQLPLSPAANDIRLVSFHHPHPRFISHSHPLRIARSSRLIPSPHPSFHLIATPHPEAAPMSAESTATACWDNILSSGQI